MLDWLERHVLGRYLELLRTSRVDREPHGESHEQEVEEELASRRREAVEPTMIPFPGKDALQLTAAGYRSKVSFSGRVIWQRPDTGFWFSEEMALCLLERHNAMNKSGAAEGR